MTEPKPLAAQLTREHRELDALFGAFLGALAAADVRRAADSLAAFDDALRLHTEEEERRAYPPTIEKGRLVPAADEDPRARTVRELRLEHVQVRELSGILRRLLAEKGDLDAARGLAGSLARRWDAHTTREERELFESAAG